MTGRWCLLEMANCLRRRATARSILCLPEPELQCSQLGVALRIEGSAAGMVSNWLWGEKARAECFLAGGKMTHCVFFEDHEDLLFNLEYELVHRPGLNRVLQGG